MDLADDKKHAVLTEISKNSRVLFSTGRLSSVCIERENAWKIICEFAHAVGLTATVYDGEHLRRSHINRWRTNFRVRFFACVF